MDNSEGNVSVSVAFNRSAAVLCAYADDRFFVGHSRVRVVNWLRILVLDYSCVWEQGNSHRNGIHSRGNASRFRASSGNDIGNEARDFLGTEMAIGRYLPRLQAIHGTDRRTDRRRTVTYRRSPGSVSKLTVSVDSVPSLSALRPWAPPAERGPSLESIYRVSITVDLCDG